MPLKEDSCQNVAAIDHDRSFVTSKGTIIAENEKQLTESGLPGFLLFRSMFSI